MKVRKRKKTTDNVGFISTRFAGTDGVSLEAAKWADLIEKAGLACYYMAGELDRPEDRSFLVPEAHFKHPEIQEIYGQCFGVQQRNRAVTQRIHAVKHSLKNSIYEFVDRFKIDMLVVENALAIPMNVPLGIALTEFISETSTPTIAHHHDFFWERQRFLNNAVWEYLNMAFPPHLPHMHHVVINSSADNQLSLRTGISSTIIPNVMDFENSPPPPDEYASDVRLALGIEEGELLILQPTRVVLRKGIEHAVEFVSRLDRKARLVISHASGDEGGDYERRVKTYSKLLGANTLFVSDIINERRGTTADGAKIYTLDDVYPFADLVTYPSTFEGFGNAFLEAIYFRKPIVINTYSIYHLDIKPKGFQVIEMDGYVTRDTIRQAHEVLADEKLRREMVAHNYELGAEHFSYSVLDQKLGVLISECLSSRKR